MKKCRNIYYSKLASVKVIIAFVIILSICGCSSVEDSSMHSEENSVVKEWYENSALLSVKLADDEVASMILNSNMESYMEFGNNIRVYLKNDKACILTKDVEVVHELSPVRLVEEIAKRCGYVEKDLRYVDSNLSKQSEKCRVYKVYGYDDIYNTLAVAGSEYAAYVTNTYNISNESNVELELVTYRGIRRYIDSNNDKCEILNADKAGYGSAIVIIKIDDVEYVVNSIQTEALLNKDFKLEEGWYKDNNSEQWLWLATNLRKQLIEIMNME